MLSDKNKQEESNWNLSVKKFWHFVGVWFLFQIVLLGAVNTSNGYRFAKNGNLPQGDRDNCLWGMNSFNTFLLGAAMPLTQTRLVYGNWCWEVLPPK